MKKKSYPAGIEGGRSRTTRTAHAQRTAPAAPRVVRPRGVVGHHRQGMPCGSSQVQRRERGRPAAGATRGWNRPSWTGSGTQCGHHRWWCPRPGRQGAADAGPPLLIAQVAPLYEAVPPGAYGGTERVIAKLSARRTRRPGARRHPVRAGDLHDRRPWLEAFETPLRERFSEDERQRGPSAAPGDAGAGGMAFGRVRRHPLPSRRAGAAVHPAYRHPDSAHPARAAPTSASCASSGRGTVLCHSCRSATTSGGRSRTST